MYNIEINFQDINVDVKSKAIALEKTGPSFLKLKKILQINHTPRDDKGGPDGGAGFALLFITSTRLSFFLYFFLSFFLFLSLSLSLARSLTFQGLHDLLKAKLIFIYIPLVFINFNNIIIFIYRHTFCFKMGVQNKYFEIIKSRWLKTIKKGTRQK